MGGFLKCVDPDDPNKFLLIRDGEIVFYENINGVPTPVTPMTQIGLYDAAGGESFTPNERYKEAPEVFVQPRSIRTFEINGAGIDQMIEIDAPEITDLSAGKYQINISGGLKGSSAGYTAVAPLGIYRTNSDESNPAWAVPVSGITEATVYGYVSGYFKIYGTEYSSFYGLNYTFRVGIGEYQSGPDYWGTAATGSYNGAGRQQVIASVSGAAGNYLHIAGNLTRGAGISVSGYQIDRAVPRLSLLGARCRGGGSSMFGDAIFTAVVVGR